MIRFLILLALFWPFTTSRLIEPAMDLPILTSDQYRATGEHFVNVSSRAQFVSALSKTQGPKVISLSPGIYNNIIIEGRDSQLRIQSASPEDPAKIAGLKLQDVANVTLQDIDLTHPNNAAYAALHARPNTASNSQNIVFQNVRFIGTVATKGQPHDIGYPSGHGLFVTGSVGVKVIGCEFRTWHRAAIFTKSRMIEVRANDIHSLRSDGLNFSAVQGVLIRANKIHGFERSLRSKDHSDMIQFWTRGTKTPSQDIRIENNILDMGHGNFTQSIFMRNEVVDKEPWRDDFFYKNLRISGNIIRNAHTHGITVGQSSDVIIEENTVTSSGPDNSLSTPIVRVHPASHRVKILGNRVAKIKGYNQQPSWLIAGNGPP